MRCPQESGKKKQDPEAKKPVDTVSFMKRKLKASREIVAGLATDDFAKMEKNAQDLMLLSHESN